MHRNHFLKVILLTAIPISLAACTMLQPEEPAKSPLRVEYTQWWGDYTLLVAQEKGIFEKYGVEVEPVYYEIFSKTYPDLAAGQIDGALIAVGDTININRNAPMKVVAVYDNGGNDAVIAGPEIDSVQDLNGKTIGLQLGSQYELTVVKMLQSAGMSMNDVNIVALDPEAALGALQSGKVQAASTWEPYSSEALSKGYKIIYPQEQLYLFPDLIVFSQSVMDERPEDIRAFLKAWFEAVDYRLQNPEETRAIAAAYLGMSIEEVLPDDNLKLLTLGDNKALFNLQEEDSIYSTTRITLDYLISIGSLAQQIDPLKLLDPSYLP
ncbi:MAG: ABC transporter substrate-binding protein [Chloroflexi bacterium]|nr:ABC transporter substrate-binding protein [Chloroflexota bacterium]